MRRPLLVGIDVQEIFRRPAAMLPQRRGPSQSAETRCLYMDADCVLVKDVAESATLISMDLLINMDVPNLADSVALYGRFWPHGQASTGPAEAAELSGLPAPESPSITPLPYVLPSAMISATPSLKSLYVATAWRVSGRNASTKPRKWGGASAHNDRTSRIEPRGPLITRSPLTRSQVGCPSRPDRKPNSIAMTSFGHCFLVNANGPTIRCWSLTG